MGIIKVNTIFCNIVRYVVYCVNTVVVNHPCLHYHPFLTLPIIPVKGPMDDSMEDYSITFKFDPPSVDLQ